MKKKEEEINVAESAVTLQHIKNAVVNSGLNAEGNIYVGDVHNYFDTPEPFTPPSLPFTRPAPHIPRRIFREKDAGNTGLFGGKESFDLLVELDKHPRIVLLGDAGMGKSTELEWICHELKESGQYVPIYRKLNSYKSSGVYLDDIDKFGREHESSIVLVLDGLDEPDMMPAKEAIEKFANNFPNAKVLVSCRSNAYADSLTGFETYQLGKLSYLDIEGYVMKTLGHSGQAFLDFWRQKYAWNQNQLIDNPFFLVRICEFVQGNNNRPPDSLGEMFEYLIEKSLDLRLKSISRFGTGNYGIFRQSCRQSLEKLAFVMECKGDNVISETEFAALVPSTDEQEVLLAKSSLLEQQGAAWRFAHNNFQEYLAAKALSRAKNFKAIKKALAAKPDYQRLKWTWVNALSFLMGLWSDDNKYKQQLLDWLVINDLEPLIKICSFEREKVSPKVREHIFKLVFEKCKKEDLIVGSHYYSYWDMAEFGESANTMRYLNEELRVAKTQTVKGNALVLLKAMRRNFLTDIAEKADLKALLLQNIYDFDQNTAENRHYAMEALFQLFGKMSEGEAVKMVETFFDREHALERSSAYIIIEKHTLQVQFMERLIGRIRDLNDHHWKKGKIHYVEEDWRIENCFKNADSEEVLISFFEMYSRSVENRWDDRHKPLNLMLEKLDGMTLSKQGVERVFHAMKSRFSDWLAHPTEAKREVILKFIEKNGLRHEFFKSIIDAREIWAGWVSPYFLDEEGIEYVVDKFRQGKLDKDWLTKYHWWVGRQDESLLSKLNQRLNEVGDEPFPMPDFKPPIDYDQVRKEKLLVEKTLYFNRGKYIQELEDIFIFFGKSSFKKHEIYDVKAEKAKENRDEDVYDRYPTMLIWMIDDHPNMSRDELKALVGERWEWISINSIQKYVQNHHQEIEKDPNLGLSDEEKAYVKNWCDAHRTKIDWNGQHTYADVAFIWFVTHYPFTHYPSDTYLQMVGSGLQNHGVQANMLEFVEQHKPELSSQLKERILDNIRSGKVQGYELHLHFDFVKNHQITEALYDLHPHIEETGGYSCEALRVYISLGGDDDHLLNLLERITPTPEDYRESILLDHFSAKKNKVFEKILLQKLTTSTEPEYQLTYARYLVRQHNLVGLQFLADYIEREKKSPFSTHAGNPDYLFENPKGVPLMLRFYDYGNDPNIPQDSFDRISSIGRNMLLHLATCQNRRYFPIVRKAIRWYLRKQTCLNKLPEVLKKQLKISRPEALKQLRYLLKDLEHNYYQKEQVTIEEAVQTWEKLS